MNDQEIITTDLMRRLLAQDKRNTMELSRGANVGYFWLRKVRRGEIKNPGFEQTSRLVHFLAK